MQFDKIFSRLFSLIALVFALCQISCTAYKTTDKLPVAGSFGEIEIGSIDKSATDFISALNSTTFRIPIASLETNDRERNHNVIAYFFGKMLNTSFITGTVGVFDKATGRGTIAINMNGVSHNIQVRFTRDGHTISFEGKVELGDWHALPALASLNKQCSEVHRGPDGVPKTGSEVDIGGNITFSP